MCAQSVAVSVAIVVAEAVMVDAVSSPVAKAVARNHVVAVADASVVTKVSPCQKSL
jgi:hypothetical protein